MCTKTQYAYIKYTSSTTNREERIHTAENFKRIRESRNVSQRAIANALGITTGELEEIENRPLLKVDPWHFHALTVVLGVNADEILQEIGGEINV